MGSGTVGVRRMTWGMVVGAPVLVGVVSAIDLLTGRYGPVMTAVLTVVLLVVFGQYLRYTPHVMRGMDHRVGPDLEHVATFAVAVLGWALVVRVQPISAVWSVLPALVVSYVVTVRPGWSRWLLVFGGTAIVVAAGGVLGRPSLFDGVLMPGLSMLVYTGSLLTQLWFWDVVLRLEKARETERALAVAEERLRFAADLHDIQGHHLQAIALKAELAERLAGRDDEQARRHARDAADLARTALRETRDVVQGYRRASLGTEITNAVGVLRAAGIDAEVTGDAAAVPPPLQPLFGALVREGTTNVLRHSRARRCRLEIVVVDGRVDVRLGNDGAGAPGEPGAGIAGLRERFAAVGGRIEVEADGEDFTLIGQAGVSR
ncbi:sensor histidine kinase [Saccharothrix violaceirubra]|uniref:Two-component system sensor histidine kinase DesK n=1 Tax=Saccharothrix violaceirubra TaxID=413306 RepID=A0A7W7T886_9PSEU|nr:histidine kinase [Saccharothrix violaceirubra]MBB4967095.1 two-component system sensor histidine kinase DesK [Saccharothrix violaceirubra]